ncbi:galactose oxidase [Dyadobacter sp. CY261]|uniref:galactose oxidase n=1 Tax=Dyadobacter sp. CY261 TaxID=2907203 RepID=UPI001F26BF59|nr:galactose oxidase [Dyadobacter sp. CY261]MCF0070181.1 galactose oxidase [Dyadobacter sp. CY261]
MSHSMPPETTMCGIRPILLPDSLMKFPIFFLTCILGVLFVPQNSANAQSHGLRFASYEVLQDQRTTLNLTPTKPVCFSQQLELAFDLTFAPKQKTYFGYIFRLIGSDKHNIDLVYDNGVAAANGRFRVITGDKLSSIAFNIPDNLLFGQWSKLLVKLDAAARKLTITAGGRTFTHMLEKVPDGCYHILFGANQHKSFQTTDVPPMTLANITLAQDGKTTGSWPLDEYSGTTARNEKSKTSAIAINPVWIEKLHETWQPRKRMLTSGFACTALDQKREILYLIGEDSLHTYSVASQITISYPYQSGRLHLAKGNQAFVDTITGNLYTYNVDQQRIARFNFATRKWDKNFIFPIPESSTEYWHSNKFFSTADSSLYVVGGYGHLTYKNEVHRYHLPSGKWTAVASDSGIYTPRYLAAGGLGAEGMYILGGYGSLTGQQILNPRNWNDLLLFQPHKRQWKKIYETDADLPHLNFANSLVITGNHFYALAFPKNRYNSELRLVRGSLDKPVFQTMAAAIPYSFHDTHSFADLFYCPGSKQLIALSMTRSEDDKQTVMHVYTLLTPVRETVPGIASAENQPKAIWPFVLAGSALLGCGAGLLYRRRNLSARNVKRDTPEHAAEPVSTTVPKKMAAQTDIQEKNSISLFGDLQVTDNNGSDITQMFTPLIKELFLVILLYTIRWKRGINSDKLRELLWSDKSTESARNNRSVNLTKLKAILSRIPHCQIVTSAGHWKMDFNEDDVHVDYFEFLNITSSKYNDRPMIEALIAITNKGSFLSNLEFEWLDPFKSEISNIVVNTYLNYAGNIPVSDDPEFMIRLANNISYFDPANEEAMILKCKSFALLGKHSLAKSTFESFTREYNNIYGEEFRRELTDILKSEV